MTMLSIDSEPTVWKVTLRSILRFCGFGSTSRANDNVAFFRAEVPKLGQAMATVRMALNPGETVATATPRIRQEALRFDEFLANPGSIRGVALNVKKFDETGSCKSSEQYAVKDPDEIQASMWHRFKASDHIVLDFVAFDEDAQPMFSILRSYSSWVGDRKCDLGNERTFHLHMVEAQETGYVNVWAGFTPPSVLVSSGTNCLPANLKPIPAAAAAGGGGGTTDSPFYRALGPVLVALVVIVSFITGGQFLSRDIKATERTTRRGNEYATDSIFAKLTAPSSSYLFKAPGNDDSTAERARELVTIAKERVMRLADIRDFRISVDKKSCNRSETRCLKLLAGFQRNLKSRFARLNLPTIAPAVSATTKPAELIVSYQQTDSGKELIHLALCDHDGNLWNAEHGLDHEQDRDLEFVDVCAEQFSTEVLVTVMRAKDQIMTATDVETVVTHEANATEK